MASQWRSKLEWDKSGLKISSPSDEACKLYDAALTQIFGFRDDPSVGGLEKTMQDMLAADPDFVLGRTLKIVSELSMGYNPKNLKSELDSLMKLAENSNITDREKEHVKAVRLYSEGQLDQAADCWEAILIDYNNDVAALNHAFYANLYLGKSSRLRDLFSGLMPQWNPSSPIYNYLYSYYAFGLQESNFYDKAEIMAKKALELNPNDVWATHTLAHVYEMQGRTDEGITFLTSTSDNWKFGNRLSCHNLWHLGLLYIEKADYESALQIFDSEIEKYSRAGFLFNLHDAASLLCRLEINGVNVANRWEHVMTNYEPHSKNNINVFNDAHIALSYYGCKDKTKFTSFKESLQEFVQFGESHYKRLTKEVGLNMVEGIEAASEGQFEIAVEKLYPIKDNFWKIGNSNAQRDVFVQFLISSAVRSSDPVHNKLAKKMLNEREAYKGKCTLRERLDLAWCSAS